MKKLLLALLVLVAATGCGSETILEDVVEDVVVDKASAAKQLQVLTKDKPLCELHIAFVACEKSLLDPDRAFADHLEAYPFSCVLYVEVLDQDLNQVRTRRITIHEANGPAFYATLEHHLEQIFKEYRSWSHGLHIYEDPFPGESVIDRIALLTRTKHETYNGSSFTVTRCYKYDVIIKSTDLNRWDKPVKSEKVMVRSDWKPVTQLPDP
jgi:hypothetical protein